MRVPPSLRNIYKELAEEIPGFKIPQHGYVSPLIPSPFLHLHPIPISWGYRSRNLRTVVVGVVLMDSDLTEWAKHGVLLLNTSLTVRAHEVSPHYHPFIIRPLHLDSRVSRIEHLTSPQSEVTRRWLELIL